MEISKFIIGAIAIVLLCFAVSIYFLPQLPEKIASHWNAAGEADYFSKKMPEIFVIPILSAIMLLLLVFLPKIDPLSSNIRKFNKFYEIFILMILGFFLYLHILTIAFNLGIKFDFLQFLSPAFGILFFYCGILIGKAEMNWSIGIRTPWTLSSEIVWKKTHNLGGKLFKISGIFCFIGLILPKFAIVFVLVPILLFSFCIAVYSFLEYKKIKK